MATLMQWLIPPAARGRDSSIDAARAVLMLYVVGYLHLGTYVGNGTDHTGWVNLPVTQLVLGGFTFISGLVLAGRPLRLTLAEVTHFYRRRFIRIYPLFLLALSGFVALGLTYWLSAVKSALGLTMFWPWAPMTLWYVVMLLVCYALAPLLLAGSLRTMLATGIGVLVFMAAWDKFVMPMDLRMATQFAAFASGVFVARARLRRIRPSTALLVAAAAALLLQFATARLDESITAWTAVPAVCLVPILMLRGLDALPAGWLKNNAIQFLSHTSLCAYLFHRIVYACFERLVHPGSDAHHWMWLLGVALPVALILAALIQTAYDQLLARLIPSAPVLAPDHP